MGFLVLISHALLVAIFAPFCIHSSLYYTTTLAHLLSPGDHGAQSHGLCFFGTFSLSFVPVLVASLLLRIMQGDQDVCVSLLQRNLSQVCVSIYARE